MLEHPTCEVLMTRQQIRRKITGIQISVLVVLVDIPFHGITVHVINESLCKLSCWSLRVHVLKVPERISLNGVRLLRIDTIDGKNVQTIPMSVVKRNVTDSTGSLANVICNNLGVVT